jgi:general secretion pathway protein G
MLLRTTAERARRRLAFTLMEVLVVLVILVVLAGISVGGVFYYLELAKESAAKVQINNIEKAVETYKLTHGDYPQSLQQMCEPEEAGKAAQLDTREIIDPWQRPYVLDPNTLNPRTQRPLIYSQGKPGGNHMIRNWN